MSLEFANCRFTLLLVILGVFGKDIFPRFVCILAVMALTSTLFILLLLAFVLRSHNQRSRGQILKLIN